MKNRQKLDLLLSLTRREVQKRYRGSFMGALWPLVMPLTMLLIYTFVFSQIFRSRWAGMQVSRTTDFAVILFVGIIAYTIFSETITKAPVAIVGNTNFVKKVVFPLETLPCVALLSTLYHSLLSLIPLAVFFAFSSFSLHWTVALVPVVLLPYLLFVLGAALVFASLGVFIRDLEQLSIVLSNMLMFLSPVFYPPSIFPDRYQWILRLNPIGVFVDAIREVVVFGRLPDWISLAWASVLSVVAFAFGSYWFSKTKKAFADVL